MKMLMNRLAAAATCTGWQMKERIREFKNDERGLSDAVVTVLLILVAVLAVVLLWDKLEGFINDIWEDVLGEKDNAFGTK